MSTTEISQLTNGQVNGIQITSIKEYTDNKSNVELTSNNNADMSKIAVNKVTPINNGYREIDNLLPAGELWTTERGGSVRLRMTEKGPGSEMPQTVVSLLKHTVDRIPDHPALCVKRDGSWQKWTFKQYYNDVCRAAKSFIKLGLEPYHGVGIMGFNSPEWFIADVGCIFAGGFATGIYTTNNAEACHFVASDSKANVIVVENTQYLNKILQVRDKLPDLKAIVQYTGEIENPQQDIYTWADFIKLGEEVPDSDLEERFKLLAPNKCCTLVYTSGTTGNPKGVMLSHDNVTHSEKALISLDHKLKFGYERGVSYLPLSHVAAQLLDIYIAMYSASTIYFAQPDALKGSLVQTLIEVRPTTFMGVPRVWEKMMEKMKEVGRNTTGIKSKIAHWAKSIGLRGNQSRLQGGSVPYGWTIANMLVFKKIKGALGLDLCRNYVSGAAPISKDTLDYFMSLDIVIDEVYGLSECSGPQNINNPQHRKMGSVGQAMPGLQTKIDSPDEDGNGEILLYGRNVFMGYLDQEEKTKETFNDEGWMRTGDIGKIDKDGFLYITGRSKEILITAGGENVAPVPIEDNVKEVLPIVSNCMLIGDKRKFLSLLITIQCDVNLDTTEPLDKLNNQALHWCQSIGSKATTVTELRQDELIQKAIQDGINAANKKAVSRAANIAKWTILEKDFSIFGGELGPTLKLKRPVVTKMYENVIEDFYKD